MRESCIQNRQKCCNALNGLKIGREITFAVGIKETRVARNVWSD